MTVTVKMMVVATDPPFETKAFLRQSKLMGWRVPNSSQIEDKNRHQLLDNWPQHVP